MVNKEVTPEESNKFWYLFASKHPDIEFKLKSKILVNGIIWANQPAKMPDEEYDIYTRFLKRWYIDNGIIEYEPDFVYVSTKDSDKKAMGIETDKIISIENAGNDLSKVVIQVDENEIKEIIIKEDAEYFKNRVYIF